MLYRTATSEYVIALRNYCKKLLKKYTSVCITGDFNFPGIDWCEKCGSSVSHKENLFLDLCSEFSCKSAQQYEFNNPWKCT